MAVSLRLAALCVVTLLSQCSATPSPTPSAVPNGIPLVPLPRQFSLGSTTRRLAPAFNLTVTGGASPSRTLSAAFERLGQVIFSHISKGDTTVATQAQFSTPPIPNLEVSVTNTSEAAPQLCVDETYTLTIPTDGPATLSAATVYGALHGLQTFSQLVQTDYDANAVIISTVPVQVTDRPRFCHRGLLLDTSRHFYPVATLVHLLDAMAAVKMNVFHWHLSDATSFPVVVPNTNLSRGAYAPSQRYSRADLAVVVEAARLRAIRVVPEFDMPAHSSSWCIGHPEICVNGSVLDPSVDATYAVIEKVIEFVADVFPDAVIHLGGDEVDLTLWTSNPRVQEYLKKEHPGVPLDVAAETEAYSTFVSRVDALGTAHGRRVTHWEDVFDWSGGGSASSICGGITPSLPNDTIVQIFRAGMGSGPTPGHVCGTNAAVTTQTAVNAGYDVIWGPPASWYLSCYSDHCSADGGGAGFEPWEQVYAGEPFHNADPKVDITDPAAQRRVLGGEVTVWSERLDPAIMIATAFPRAAAAAERLWSSAAVDLAAETTAARPRLNALRCALLDRGLSVSTLSGGNEASPLGLPSRPQDPGPNC